MDPDPIAQRDLLSAIDHVRRLCAADSHPASWWIAEFLGAYVRGDATDLAAYVTATENTPGHSVRREARRDRVIELVREAAARLCPCGDVNEQARAVERAMARGHMTEAVELAGRPLGRKAISRMLVGNQGYAGSSGLVRGLAAPAQVY